MTDRKIDLPGVKVKKIPQINQVIASYFKNNPSVTEVQAKELMSHFIAAGIFNKNHRDGLPIRKILRELDESNKLHLIPYVFPERNAKNTYWYFVNMK